MTPLLPIAAGGGLLPGGKQENKDGPLGSLGTAWVLLFSVLLLLLHSLVWGQESPQALPSSSLRIEVKDGKVDLFAKEASLHELLKELGEKGRIDIRLLGKIEDRKVSLEVKGQDPGRLQEVYRKLGLNFVLGQGRGTENRGVLYVLPSFARVGTRGPTSSAEAWDAALYPVLWKSKPLPGEVFLFDGKGDPRKTRPGWAVMKMPSKKRGQSNAFTLFQFDSKEGVAESVHLGDGIRFRAAVDGTRFNVAEGYYSGARELSEINQVYDSQGKLIKELEPEEIILRLGGEKDTTITIGPESELRVYDPSFKVLASYYFLFPDTYPGLPVLYRDGVTAIQFEGYAHVIDATGNYLLKERIFWAEGPGHPTIGIFPKNQWLIHTGKEEKAPAVMPYISLVDFSGKELWRTVPKMKGASFEPLFMFSPQGEFILAYDWDNICLFDKQGSHQYTIFVSGGSHLVDGELTDEGIFFGTLTNKENLVAVSRDGTVADLGISMPLGEVQLDLVNGRVLCQEKDRMIQKKIPEKTMDIIRQLRGGR